MSTQGANLNAIKAQAQKLSVQETLKTVFVILSNQTKIRFVAGKQEKDEFTRVLRVFEDKASAEAFYESLPKVMNTSYYIIETPFIEAAHKEENGNEKK